MTQLMFGASAGEISQSSERIVALTSFPFSLVRVVLVALPKGSQPPFGPEEAIETFEESLFEKFL